MNHGPTSLRSRALTYLARREFSRAELRRKLASSDAEEQSELEALLDELVEQGYLSDERVTEQYLNQKQHRFGSQRLAHELRQKGVPEQLITDAIQQLKQQELDIAREVWRKKFAAPPVDAKEKARQIRFLQSRGFALEVIFNILNVDESA